MSSEQSKVPVLCSLNAVIVEFLDERDVHVHSNAVYSIQRGEATTAKATDKRDFIYRNEKKNNNKNSYH